MMRTEKLLKSAAAILAVVMVLAACTQQTDPLELFAGGDVVIVDGGSSQELAGSTISGTIELEAPYRSRWVTRVGFYLDGVPGEGTFLAEPDARPFIASLDTTTLADGPHTLVTAAVAEKRNGTSVRMSDTEFIVDNSGSTGPANSPPSVEAGPDLVLVQGSPVQLAGHATDDGLPGDGLHLGWSKRSGPGSVTFSNASVAEPSATIDTPGDYVLRLTANDGDLSNFDEVTVTVLEPSSAPPPSPGPVDDEVRGDPSFDASSLPADAALWYERFWTAIENPNQYPNTFTNASSGDLYQLGRFVNTHITTVLTVFRATGDLALLDHVDAVMERARAELRDYDGDGYVNWRWLKEAHPTYYGNDIHVMDELMTHGMVAAVAWAFENNRDLVSPSGVPYGERADFWRDYLLNVWEAKWRDRNGVPSGFPFIEKELIHPFLNLARFHWYAYRLTGERGYLDEAERMADILHNGELRMVATGSGDAMVWPHQLVSANKGSDYVQPIHYARYAAQVFIDLALEPFPGFDSNDLAPIARSVSQFVIDNGAEDFAPTIGGSGSIGGLSYPSGEPRTRTYAWAIYPLVEYAAWDASGDIAAVSEQVYSALENDDNPRRIAIPAGLVLQALIGNDASDREDR